jgi:hypothetical protein
MPDEAPVTKAVWDDDAVVRAIEKLLFLDGAVQAPSPIVAVVASMTPQVNAFRRRLCMLTHPQSRKRTRP